MKVKLRMMLKIKLFSFDKCKQVLPYINNFILSRCLKTSSDNAKPSNPEVIFTDEIAERKIDEVRKVPSKKVSRPPFVKSLFSGKFDTVVFAYPQIVEKDRYEMLDELLKPVKNFFEGVGSKMNSEAKIPPEILQGLKDLGLYGLKIPEEYGGLGLSDMEYARIAEVFALDGSITITLSAHHSLGVTGLLMAGTDEQKRKYLPKLASGEWTAALCITEIDKTFDVAAIETRALPTDDGKGYRLSGTKNLVFHDGMADLLIVFAHFKYPNTPPSDEGILTGFLVERNFEGVRGARLEKKLDMHGTNTSEIHFDDTFVPTGNMFGKIGDGVKLLSSILNFRMLSMGSCYASILKGLLKRTVEHVVTCKQFGNTLSEFGIIKEKLARITFDIYAMESMTYLTAGLIDTYEDQDCAVESAIIKIFSSEKVWEHVSNCLQVLGGRSFFKGHPYERLLRDGRVAQTYDGSNDFMKIFIGLSGLQHASNEIQEAMKSRGLLNIPYLYLKSVNELLLNRKWNPKLDLKLHQFLHPTLKESANELEYCTKRFESASKDLLKREGLNIALPSKQWDVKRMADVAIDLYAMTAVLSRASRSYCIGVHNSDQEVRIAKYFVSEATQRIKHNLEQVFMLYHKPDMVLENIAYSLFEKGKYHVKHPFIGTF